MTAAIVPAPSGLPAQSEDREVLNRKGHRLAGPDTTFGGYQAILHHQENDVYFGASESRKDGQAAGY